MNVIRAEVLGMCFGVRDALKVIDKVVDPAEVTIFGQLVHNEQVVHNLTDRGFSMIHETDRVALPESSTVLITAHGISDRERSRLSAAGKRLIDTTCPLVTRVHQAARRLHDDGDFVLVIGRRGHVEVRGIIEDLDRFEVVESAEDVRVYNESRLGIVSQTTVPSEHAARVLDAIQTRNPDATIRFVDTVCQPTKDHQKSLERLLNRVDAVVVVGGRNSNNTKELVTLCQNRGVPALHLQSAQDIDPAWFVGFETVGLTAGTSTLDTTIHSIEQALQRLTPVGATSRIVSEPSVV